MEDRGGPCDTSRAAVRRSSLDDAKPLRDNLKIIRFYIPGAELRVQRMQRDLLMGPLVFAGLPLRAGVSLHRVAIGFVQNSATFDQHDLALARPLGMEVEQIEAAVRNPRLHRTTHYVAHEQVAA